MQSLIKLSVYFLLCWPFLVSCKKEKIDEITQSGYSSPDRRPVNHAPVANAGTDINLSIISCYSDHYVELNGTNSYDPDNDIVNYSWSKIAGPYCYLSNTNIAANINVSSLMAGQYAFELKVTDKGGLSSRDTVLINVSGGLSPIDLDVTINTSYSFSDNVEECFDDFIYYCYYYDLTTIEGNFNLSSLGQMYLGVHEQTDTSTYSDNHDTQIGITCIGYVPAMYLGGTCSINFKRLIQQGGGPFNGTFRIETGSAAINCEPDIFTNINPLSVSGVLDTTTHSVNLTIKGKVYF